VPLENAIVLISAGRRARTGKNIGSRPKKIVRRNKKFTGCLTSVMKYHMALLGNVPGRV
jgi:hypothetical protein